MSVGNFIFKFAGLNLGTCDKSSSLFLMLKIDLFSFFAAQMREYDALNPNHLFRECVHISSYG